MKQLLAAILLVLVASPAIAQPRGKRDPNAMAQTDCERLVAQGKKCKILKIEGETVIGDKPGGEGINVPVLNWGDHASLVRIRKHFIPEIIKSAEDVD
jgi:hypothetical protein